MKPQQKKTSNGKTSLIKTPRFIKTLIPNKKDINILRSDSARVGAKAKTSLTLFYRRNSPLTHSKSELNAVNTCTPFWNLTPNYSELIISYFCLLSRLGEAAFIIIIIRYKNNYTSTETYSTCKQRKTSPLTSQ